MADLAIGIFSRFSVIFFFGSVWRIYGFRLSPWVHNPDVVRNSTTTSYTREEAQRGGKVRLGVYEFLGRSKSSSQTRR